jgi:hypothetical protein
MRNSENAPAFPEAGEDGESQDPKSRPKGESQDGDDANDDGESLSLADLLAEDGEEKSAEGESRKKTPTKRLLDLAETLGRKPEDLYDLEVTVSEGKSMKIGELKDLAQKGIDHDAAALELETQRQEQEAKYARLRGEFTELIRAIPKTALNSEAFAKAAERYEARLTKAREATASAIEEWQDAEVAKTERAGISEFLNDWGFEESYLANVVDPRSMRFIRDAWKLSQRVKAALSKVKRTAQGNKEPKPGQGGKPPKSSAKGGGKSSTGQRGFDALLD